MAEQVSKRSVFISYSRKDKEFVRKLNDSLDSSEIEAWVDWEGIPPSSDWMDEIQRAIEGADAFLFVHWRKRERNTQSCLPIELWLS